MDSPSSPRIRNLFFFANLYFLTLNMDTLPSIAFLLLSLRLVFLFELKLDLTKQTSGSANCDQPTVQLMAHRSQIPRRQQIMSMATLRYEREDQQGRKTVTRHSRTQNKRAKKKETAVQAAESRPGASRLHVTAALRLREV
ncbi:hypothetical protein BCV70DRAFT_8030 [Testicularia cyperi]|uniref:Uncharacterized protein n=1 Tax=Testicularia cyperi TaxID=1882483 RepID=A0A317XYP0_9BASI|nr:hypothetical protein BCV70DRAFT_8030 [Testicularia cyperi]